MRKSVYSVFLILYIVTLSKSAYAYLDPGTGSIILQVLLGGIAGVLVVGRLYWQRVKEFFGVKSALADSSDQEQAKGDQNTNG